MVIFTRFSFLTAFIWSSLFIGLLYQCRKKRKLLELTGITPLLILTVGTLVRCFLPIDIPNFTRVIESHGILAVINFILYVPWGNTPLNLVTVLMMVWGIGCIRPLWRFISGYVQFLRRTSQYIPTTDGPLIPIARAAAKELHTFMPRVVETDCVSSPTLCGFFRPTVLLPSLNFDERAYRYVFLHELMHWKERDPHIKLLTKLFCCIFWWNPCCRYLKSDLSDILEFRCDQSLAVRFSLQERHEYAYVLADAITDKSQREDLPYCVTEFRCAQEEIVERVNLMLKAGRRKKEQKLASALAIMGLILMLIFSYSFVIQSHYDAPEDEIITTSLDFEFSQDNAYLVENSDGTFTLYIDNIPFGDVDAEKAKMLQEDGFIIKTEN